LLHRCLQQFERYSSSTCCEIVRNKEPLSLPFSYLSDLCTNLHFFIYHISFPGTATISSHWPIISPLEDINFEVVKEQTFIEFAVSFAVLLGLAAIFRCYGVCCTTEEDTMDQPQKIRDCGYSEGSYFERSRAQRAPRRMESFHERTLGGDRTSIHTLAGLACADGKPLKTQECENPGAE